MAYAAQAYGEWGDNAADVRNAGMLVDDRYQLAGTNVALPIRLTETVTISGVDIVFDVSKSHGEVPQPVRECLGRLVELSCFKTDWDSYGSVRLDRNVVKPAVELIVEGFRPCLFPEINLTSVGGLNLSWECEEGKELEIELLPNGLCDFVYEDENGESSPEQPVSLDEARRMLKKLRA